MAKCDCYFQHGLKFLCYGTKEMEECSCGGDKSKCDFYPENRKQKTANGKRLIDVDAFRDYWNKNYRHQYANDTFLFALANFPTVDAVEVVRCKDCQKRYNPKECPMCVRVYGEQHDFTQENGYCDRGERRTDV